jgi:RNA polymerase sigma-70 factor (ECF subfamily)
MATVEAARGPTDDDSSFFSGTFPLLADHGGMDLAPPASASLTDEDVIAAVLSGHLPLFELLMRRYNQRLFRVARAITRSDHEAEDVVQDAWVRAFSHLEQCADRTRAAQWLTRICANEALRRVRRTARLVDIATPEDGDGGSEGLHVMALSSQGPSPEDGASDREMAHLLERAIDDLPEAFRLVFVLRAVEQLSSAETAACLGIPEETVKTRLFRARALLREDLVRRIEAGARSAFSFDGARCDRIVAAVLGRVGPAGSPR